MNFDIKKNQLNFNTLKAKKIKTIQKSTLNTLERDSMRNLVSSFRKGLIPNKINKSKHKTSKNSPEKVYIEKPKTIKNKMNPSNINNNFNKIKINSNIFSNQNDRKMDNILKKK
jgi:preprotein translocase subunit SecA